MGLEWHSANLFADFDNLLLVIVIRDALDGGERLPPVALLDPDVDHSLLTTTPTLLRLEEWVWGTWKCGGLGRYGTADNLKGWFLTTMITVGH